MSDITCVPPEAVTAAHDDLTAWMLKYGWLAGLTGAQVRSLCSEIVNRVLENADLALTDLGVPDPVAVSRSDVRAVVRLARLSRHLAEDPATDRLAEAAGPEGEQQ